MRHALPIAVALSLIATRALANGRFPQANDLVIDPADSAHLVVRTTFGVLQSFDVGKRWSWLCEAAIYPNGFEDPPLAVSATGNPLLGIGSGLRTASKSGCNWHALDSLAEVSVTDLASERGAAARVYASVVAAANTTRIAVSDVSGAQFEYRGAELRDAVPVTLDVAPSDTNRLYLGLEDASLENGFIAVSSDGGENWQRYPAPSGPDSVYVSAVDPNDANHVYVRSSSLHVLYESRDGAQHFNEVYASDNPLTGFALSPDGSELAVGGANGVVVFAAEGDSYREVARLAAGVSCLRWGEAGLYACGADGLGAFSLGLWRGAGRDFEPLLRFAQLTPASCEGDPKLAACAEEPCEIKFLFGASCKPAPSQSVKPQGGGCALRGSENGHGLGLGVAALGAVLHLRRRPREKLARPRG